MPKNHLYCAFHCVQVFGIVVKLSDGILGVTLLAWGNSIQGKGGEKKFLNIIVPVIRLGY